MVDTTNYRAGVLMNNSDKLHVIERFQRTAGDYITWTVTFDDPETWAKPWTVEIPLRHTTDALYEYACHAKGTTASRAFGRRPRRGCPRGCQGKNRAQVVFADGRQDEKGAAGLRRLCFVDLNVNPS